MPKYSLIVATTVDGRIARNSHHHSYTWTSDEDKALFKQVRETADIHVIGRYSYEEGYNYMKDLNCIVFSTQVKGVERKSDKCVYINPAQVDVESYLAEKNYQHVLCLGGVQVYSWFLAKKLVDDFYLTIEPLVFGAGLPIFDKPLAQDLPLKLISCKQANTQGTIFLHYQCP